MSRRSAGLVLGAILLGALALRLWHIGHGLPFAYNADEAEHFVPRAIAMAGGGSLDPGYYENPPALTYGLAAVYALGGLAGGFAADPTAAFTAGRVVVALLGTLVVALSYWAGARYADRRAGLAAAALMAVAFLPVFYAKHALNDVVALVPVGVALLACLAVLERGRAADWALAGGAVGAATATKYTAGAMLATVAVAAALRVLRDRDRDRGRLRSAVVGLAVAGIAFAVVFVALDPFAVLNPGEARRQVRGQSRQADSAKLGHDEVLGWFYYARSLTWGFGWVPLIAAVGGAVVALRRDRDRALLLLVLPVLLFAYLGAQGRFFGRWLLPAYPMLCVLAGIGLLAAARAVGATPRRAGIALAALVALACAQGALASLHVGRVLGREDTRAQARAWLDANVPAGTRLAVEPFVPAEWLNGPYAGGRRFAGYPVPRPFQAYEKRLRPQRLERFRRGGYCWVVVGSLQKGRGLKAGLRGARAYYRALDAASVQTTTFAPWARGARPVPFSYDDSFNYRPRAYARPGPVVEIHRLRDCVPRPG